MTIDDHRLIRYQPISNQMLDYTVVWLNNVPNKCQCNTVFVDTMIIAIRKLDGDFNSLPSINAVCQLQNYELFLSSRVISVCVYIHAASLLSAQAQEWRPPPQAKIYQPGEPWVCPCTCSSYLKSHLSDK